MMGRGIALRFVDGDTVDEMIQGRAQCMDTVASQQRDFLRGGLSLKPRDDAVPPEISALYFLEIVGCVALL
jgi:hypothetical protein